MNNELNVNNRKYFHVIVGFFLFILAFSIANKFFATWGGTPHFYQDGMAPAVLATCGYGYNNVDMKQIPSLQDFLTLKVNQFSCQDIPENIEFKDLSLFQTVHKYLYFAVIIVWKLTGVAWTSVNYLSSFMYGISAVLVYSLFRVWMRNLWSVLFAIIFSLSTIQLLNSPHLRDYSKTPFIIGMCLIIALIIFKPLKKTSLLWLSGIGGLVLGIGFGFRTDLIVFIPPFIISICLFLPEGLLKNIKLKVFSIVIFIIFFITPAIPILNGYSSGSNISHVILLGLTSWFDVGLEINRSPLYEPSFTYNDEHVKLTINSYANRIFNEEDYINFDTVKYENYSSKYLMEYLQTFPADFLIRFYVSILNILELPFEDEKLGTAIIQNDLLSNVSGWTAKILSFFQGYGKYLLFLTVIITSVKDLRLSIAVLFYSIFFMGYPVLEFDRRHFFYLEFVSLGMLGFLINSLHTFIKDKQYKLLTVSAFLEVKWKQILLFYIIIIVLFYLPLFGLREYQTNNVAAMIEKYQKADKEKLEYNILELDSEQVEIRPFLSKTNQSDLSNQTEYLVLEFKGENNQRIEPFEIKIKYESYNPYNDYSKTKMVSSYEGINTQTNVYFPILNTDKSHFVGVEMEKKYASYFKSISRFTNLSEYPLLLELNIPQNWEQLAPYQTINNSNRRYVYTAPNTLNINSTQEIETRFDKEEILMVEDILKIRGKKWIVNGQAKGIYSYIGESKEMERRHGDILIIRGKLEQGGFQIGLQREGAWDHFVTVSEQGEFEIAIEASKDGLYKVVLANFLKEGDLKNEFIISEIGWAN